jgi:hypothetical protein
MATSILQSDAAPSDRSKNFTDQEKKIKMKILPARR